MLNTNQLKVINAKEQVIFLLAGAGTGKTTVIINRLNKILKETTNKTFLLITFTKKGVQDLKLRTKLNNENLLITTFHGLCYQLLKDLNLKIIKEEQLILEGYSIESLRKIDIYKRNNINNKELKKYNNYLKKVNKIDFNDLEILLLKKLKEDLVFKNEINNLFDYIFIDEFQDTSTNQYKLIKYLKNKENYLFAVGDPDQSIYNFRGASDKVIINYINDFKASKYEMLLNYRSSKTIINKANKLISFNKRKLVKKLTSNNLEDGEVRVSYFKDDNNKIDYLLKKIKDLVRDGIKFHEIAILYRNNHLVNKIKLAFFKHYIYDINLLTIHQSKGLEFKVVFIIGLNEGILPMYKSNIEEERRLFYVALTRAKLKLFLLVNSKYKISRFLKEIK